jgi:arsenate reductase (glutaredoxin)
MAQVSIYHNPKCSKSRQTLKLLQQNQIDPEIILYLNTPPSESTLKEILAMLSIGPRDLMRKSEDAYKEQNLGDAAVSDSDLIQAMLNEPRLIERPIVVANGKAIIGRPPENVLEII